jgi:hypothetical protein
MDIETEIKILFNLDISKLKKQVLELEHSDWQFNTERQKKFYVHRNTESIVLIWDSKKLETTISKNLYENILNIANTIKDYYGKDAKILRLMLAKLLPQSEISPHTDTGILEYAHRCHLPLITNEQNIFIINEKPFYFKEGEVYEFNNTMTHSVLNNSNINRIHLICDILP